MTEKQPKATPVKTFFAEVGWRIKQGFGSYRRFVEKYLPFLQNWPQWLKAIFYLLPAMILLGIFTFYPIINSFMVSFYEGYGYDSVDKKWLFDGISLTSNYAYVLGNEDFIQAIVNTFTMAIITVPTSVIIALLIAVAMSSIKPLKGLYQSVFFLPYVTNSIALGLVFAFMFKNNGVEINNYLTWVANGADPANTPSMSFGLINQILVWFGGQPVAWIGSGATYWSALTVILVYTIWNGLAFKIIVFMAGIQGIDKQYYQAAQIDGATKIKTFWRITVPMISPMIFYILVTSMIGAFKTYSSVVAIIGTTGKITAGAEGPIDLRTIVFYVYDFLQFATTNGQLSYAAAASIVLFGIILVFTLLQFWAGKKRVHY